MLNNTQGVRRSEIRRNNPFIEAMEFYYSLMTSVGDRCHSGMAELFSIQSCGVDLSLVPPPDANIFTGHRVDYAPSELLRNSLANTDYTAFCLTSNLKSWLDMLVANIARRVTGYCWTPGGENQDEIIGSDRDLGQQRFYSYPPSDMIIGRMMHTMAVAGRQSGGTVWDNITEQDLWLSVEALKVSLDTELHGIVASAGRAMPTTLRKEVVLDWCKWVNTVTDIPTTDFKRLLLPLFRICLSLMRMLYGQVAHLGEENTLRFLGEDRRKIRISNETLLSIPAVSIDIVARLQESDALPISSLGLCYVDRLMAFYNADEN